MATTGLACVLITLLAAGCTGGQADGSDNAAATVSATPSSLPNVAVAQRDFAIELRLDGQTQTSNVVNLVPGPAWTLVPSLSSDSTVAARTEVGELQVRDDIVAQLEASGSVIDAGRLADLRAREGPVRAPAAGTFVAEPDPVLRSTGLDVATVLTPIQVLRLESMPLAGTAIVETVDGRRQFDCDALWLASAGGSPSPGEGGGAPDVAAASVLHCRLPNHAASAAGLPALLTLRSPTVPKAIVVPNVFIGYDEVADSYFVTVEGADGPRRVHVDVGPTDGVVRVIRGGDLAAGMPLLQTAGQ